MCDRLRLLRCTDNHVSTCSTFSLTNATTECVRMSGYVGRPSPGSDALAPDFDCVGGCIGTERRRMEREVGVEFVDRGRPNSAIRLSEGRGWLLLLLWLSLL